MTFYPITPMGAVRQTQSDKWAKRPPVLRYRAFSNEVKLHKVQLPENAHIVFWLPMPDSWSKKKKQEFNAKPHQQKPDIDNLLKALLDSIYEDDAHVWRVSAEKRWAFTPGIAINGE